LTDDRPPESYSRADPVTVFEAFAHPVRGRILAAIVERPDVTIRELADRLGEPSRRVRHNVEVLLGTGLVWVTGEENRQGVVERHFGAGPGFMFGGENSLSHEQRAETAKITARLVMENIAVAAAAGTLGGRPDDYGVRMYGEVDESCLVELGFLHSAAFESLTRTIDQGRRRLAENGGAGTEIVSALFFFEAPLWGERPARRPDPRIAGGGRPDEDLARRPPDRSHPMLDPQALAAVFRHPIRGKVLTALSERPDVTIREIAARTGETPRRVRHQVEALVATGLAEVTSRENLSGVMQLRYGAGPVAVDDFSQLTRQDKERMARTVVRMVAEDLSFASEAGTLVGKDDEFEVRIYGEVDGACVGELADLHERIYREIRKAVEDGRDRVNESGEPGTEIVSALFHLEVPLWRPIVAGR
jgi:DNA-binding transcriptional ArsR family regulator